MKRVLLLAFLCAAAPADAADELGRLFFTPEQRMALDARRKARVPDKPAAAAVASPTTRIDGYVKRSGGPPTVWLNGDSLPDGAPEAPRIEQPGGTPDGRVSISVGEGANRVRLKPGEVLDRGSGEVRDVIGDGEIRVHPNAPKP